MTNNIKYLHKFESGQRLKVAAYARISKDKDALEDSLENQIKYYTTLINSYPEFEFAGIYPDDGISGGTIRKRNQFQIMLQNAFAHQIDIIIVKSISRFARNVIDLLSTIQELRDFGVEVYFEKEGISTLDLKSDNYLTLYAKFAEEELVSMSKNVEWTIKRKMESGDYNVCGYQLFGYSMNDERKLVINEREARWVRLMFEMYVDGKNTAEIADFLEVNQVRTLTGNTRWSSTSIRRILKNEKYCGDILLQKTYSESPITQRRVINHGERTQYLVRNAIPAIVSREVWQKAQDRMEGNAKLYHIGIKNCHNLQTQYTTFGWCPHCRNNYFRKFNRKIEMLYCSQNRERLNCTNSESVYIEHLDRIIPILVKKLKANESEFKKALIDAFSDSAVIKQIQSEITSIDNEIDLLNERMKELDKESNNDAFVVLRGQIQREINELITKKNILNNEIITSTNPEGRANSIIDELRNFPNCESIGNYEFRKLFKKLIIINRDKLVFVVGSDDMSNIPYNPNAIPMSFIDSMPYKFRSRTFTTHFGIYINK